MTARRKWLIFVTSLVAIALAVMTIGGIVMAADDGGATDTTTTPTATKTAEQSLIDRICAIYQEKTGTAIDPQTLQDSIAQARAEARDDALKARLDSLVAEGKLTQEQADSILSWWQARPDVLNGQGLLGGQGIGGRFIGMNCLP